VDGSRNETALAGTRPTRRAFVVAAAMTVLGTPSAGTLDRDVPEAWLGATRYVDCDAPSVCALAARITTGLDTPRAKAIALHDHVRDDVRFGFAPAFYDMTASEVLEAGIGYCNTKSTLFIALLRAAGIPARQRFVDIRADVLDGVLSPGTPYVDHSYTEVWIDGAWRRTDSYIVDRALHGKAKPRLAAEGRLLGHGVHRDGTTDWNGVDDAFSQYVHGPGMTDIATRDYGTWSDVGAFYEDKGARWNRKDLFLRIGLWLSVDGANRALDLIRRS
jgi:transglutaminase-like putative cysteine protease